MLEALYLSHFTFLSVKNELLYPLILLIDFRWQFFRHRVCLEPLQKETGPILLLSHQTGERRCDYLAATKVGGRCCIKRESLSETLFLSKSCKCFVWGAHITSRKYKTVYWFSAGIEILHINKNPWCEGIYMLKDKICRENISVKHDMISINSIVKESNANQCFNEANE